MTRELVTATEAARRVGRPRTTVLGWIDRGLLRRVGIDAEGREVYDRLDHLIDSGEATTIVQGLLAEQDQRSS